MVNRRLSNGMRWMRFWRYLKNNYQMYLLLLPGVVFIFIFCYVPMYGIQIAFKDFSFRKGIIGSSWVGMEHFIRFVTSSNFWPLLRNTLGISVYSLVAGFPMPILLALKPLKRATPTATARRMKSPGPAPGNMPPRATARSSTRWASSRMAITSPLKTDRPSTCRCTRITSSISNSCTSCMPKA